MFWGLSGLSQSLAVPSSSSGKEIHSFLFPDCCIALWVSSEQIMLCVCVFFHGFMFVWKKKNRLYSDVKVRLPDRPFSVNCGALKAFENLISVVRKKNKNLFYRMSNCTLNGFKNSHVVQKSLSLIAPFLLFNEPFRNDVCCWHDFCGAKTGWFSLLLFLLEAVSEGLLSNLWVFVFFIGWWSWDEEKINNGNLKTLRLDG